jgi:hypothetical protein
MQTYAVMPSMGPSRPWEDVAGTPYVRVGSSLVDVRAYGASELLKSVSHTDGRPVIGIFDTRTACVLNAFSLGSRGVREHRDALPPGMCADGLGGFSMRLEDDGRVVFAGSSSLPAAVTAAVRRRVLRHLGVRPARLDAVQHARRMFLAVFDWACACA